MIYLPSWVIQDGNYADFTVGETRSFALSMFDVVVRPGADETTGAVWREGFRYDVVATVAYSTTELLMLDFGLLAYDESRPQLLPAGASVKGQVALEIDCYSYYEIHAKVAGVPAAVYSWTITGIWRETAPYISEAGSKARFRDPTHLGWLSLDQTDAWHDDSSLAEYLLRCRRNDVATTRHP